MQRHTLTAVALAAAMIFAVLAPLGAAAGAATAATNDDLSIDVDQTDGVVVTVTENETVAENATLEVSLDDENDSYEGVENYTDENGTFELPTPNETVDVSLTASVENQTAVKSVTLEAADDEDGDEDDERPETFGALVSQFVSDNKDDTDGPFGIAVANFVIQNNPGDAPEHAGPPAEDERGPPTHAGSGDDAEDGDDDEPGPPAHAGPGGDDTEEDETDEDAGDDDSDEDEDQED
ncbi:hypothetical protein ACLI4Y_06830 [Natrialbaceae archaeon A-CW3]